MRKRRPFVGHSRVIAVALLVVAMATSACSKSEKAEPAPPPTTAPGSAAGAASTYPLTGRPASDPAVAGRAALSVKIDNIAVARPQAGIDKADVIYEELTEGITRFIVVFHSTDADPIGPVRSVRPADPAIIFPLGGLFVFSGGSPAVRRLVPGAPVKVVDENATDALRRRSGRRAPHNLYTSTAALYKKAEGTKAPAPFATFLREGERFGGAGAAPAAGFSLAAAPQVRADYTWDAGAATWKRGTDGRPHTLEGGAQIAPHNVIVQFTPYNRFSGDAKVQYPEVIGSGDATIFAGGSMVRARWSKPGASAVTTYTDGAGAPIALPPGQTWVHLVTPGTNVTTR